MKGEKKLEDMLNKSKALVFDICYWEELNAWIGQVPIIVNGEMRYTTKIIDNTKYKYVSTLHNGHKIYVHKKYEI